MWSNWLEKGQEIAEKARLAAEALEAKLDDSVGLSQEQQHEASEETGYRYEDTINEEEEDEYNDDVWDENDAFYEDEEEFDFGESNNDVDESTKQEDESTGIEEQDHSLKQPVIITEDKIHVNDIAVSENEESQNFVEESTENVESLQNEDEKNTGTEYEIEEDQNDEQYIQPNTVEANENSLEYNETQNIETEEAPLAEPEDESGKNILQDPDIVFEKTAIDTETTGGNIAAERENIDELDEIDPDQESEPVQEQEQETEPENIDEPENQDITLEDTVECISSENDVGYVEVENISTEPESSKNEETIEDHDIMIKDDEIAEPQSNDTTDRSLPTIENDSLPVPESQSKAYNELENKLNDLKALLLTRESQLKSKTEQIATLHDLHNQEKEYLQQKVREIKEESKKRIMKAKERVEDMQARMKQVESTNKDYEHQLFSNKSNHHSLLQEKEEIIEQLRAEGQKLANSQGLVNQNLKQSREAVEKLTEDLDEVTASKMVLEDKFTESKSTVEQLKKDLKDNNKNKELIESLTDELSSTKHLYSQQKETNESLQSQIESLQQMLDQKDLETSRKEEIQSKEISEQLKKTQKDKAEIISEMEKKMYKMEREANVREDSLRKDVEELRKRWQDSVQRADALSVDIQQSTGPLMRQLESTERQNRIRAMAWTETENKLRSELENYVTEKENLLSKASSQDTIIKKLERQLEKKTINVETLSREKEDLINQTEDLESQIDEMKSGVDKMKEKSVEAEKLANDSCVKIRNEMMETMMSNEDRYKVQIEQLELKLYKMKQECEELKKELEESRSEHQEIMRQLGSSYITSTDHTATSKNNTSLLSDQASILQQTLGDDDEALEEIDVEGNDTQHATSSSFMAVEQLSQALKSSKLEIESLRQQLVSSERARSEIYEALSSAKSIAEKLPLFERKVAESSKELKEKDLEIRGLREDMMEIKEMYRVQLDALLEEQAANTPLPPPRPTPQEEDPDENGEDENYDFVAANFDF